MVRRISFVIFGLVLLGSCDRFDHPPEPELEQGKAATADPDDEASPTPENHDDNPGELEGDSAQFD